LVKCPELSLAEEQQPWLGAASGAGRKFCSSLAGRLYSLGVFWHASPSFTHMEEHFNVFS